MNGSELLVIVVLALVLIGPERLPHYAEQLARLVRGLKKFTTDTSDRVRDEFGVDVNDLELQKYDPRQYDPRRIVREALQEELTGGGSAARRPAGTSVAAAAAGAAGTAAATSRAAAASSAAGGPAPFDDEAT